MNEFKQQFEEIDAGAFILVHFPYSWKLLCYGRIIKRIEEGGRKSRGREATGNSEHFLKEKQPRYWFC